jgi:hypothetical protein
MIWWAVQQLMNCWGAGREGDKITHQCPKSLISHFPLSLLFRIFPGLFGGLYGLIWHTTAIFDRDAMTKL